jgi:hypothetical protein
VYGEADNADTSGVSGLSIAGTGVSGTSTYGMGVSGTSSSATLPGVNGENDSVGAAGVYGYSNNGYGVYGYSSTGYAGYFWGNIKVTGAITAGGKDFVIDHPLDPANKYLVHASVESSEMMNIYTGNVILGDSGTAWVTLPNYFEALNRDFRYQLTAIGAPGPNLYVAQEIANNRFQIAGGTPGGKVSWQVTGVRQDAFARAHPLIPEVEKTGEERGKYLHPVEHGQPKSMGIDESRRAKMHPQKPTEPPQRAAIPEPPLPQRLPVQAAVPQPPQLVPPKLSEASASMPPQLTRNLVNEKSKPFSFAVNDGVIAFFACRPGMKNSLN